MVARNQQVVVIVEQVPPFGVWKYCRPSVGRFRLLVQVGDCGVRVPEPPVDPPDRLDALTLAGQYVAYDAVWCSREPPSSLDDTEHQVRIFDTIRGRAVAATEGEIGPRPSTLLLSLGGVATWLRTTDTSPHDVSANWTSEVQALSVHSGQTLTLDSVPVSGPTDPGGLANLALYQCAAGCAPNTTVVAWTHSGEQRYAQVG